MWMCSYTPIQPHSALTHAYYIYTNTIKILSYKGLRHKQQIALLELNRLVRMYSIALRSNGSEPEVDWFHFPPGG